MRVLRSFLTASGAHVSSTASLFIKQIRHCSLTTGSWPNPQYQLPILDKVEDVEKYRVGGFHPIRLGTSMKDGRYRIVHKLGFGGFSTIWLARDEYQLRLVAIKVLTADASKSSKELESFQYASEALRGSETRNNLWTPLDTFTVHGPNGTHTCFVSRVGGPSFAAMSDSPGEVAGTRRLRGSLVRKLARQLVSVMSLLHESDIVHGGQSYCPPKRSFADSLKF